MTNYINDLRQCIDCIGESYYQLSKKVYPKSRSKFNMNIKTGFLMSTISFNSTLFQELDLELELRVGDTILYCSPMQAVETLRLEIRTPKTQYEYALFRGQNMRFGKILEFLQKKGYSIIPRLK